MVVQYQRDPNVSEIETQTFLECEVNVYLVSADPPWHVVPVVLGPKPREGDGVLDVDGVVFGSRNEWSVRVLERQLVNLNRTPRHDLADVDPSLSIALHTFAGQGTVTF